MDEMDDKKVGEIWTETLYRPAAAYGEFSVEAVRGLIRKLVDDRATIHWHHRARTSPTGTNPHEALELALDNFGIDPATWPWT